MCDAHPTTHEGTQTHAPVVRLPPLGQSGLLEKAVSVSKLCGPVRRHTIAVVACPSPVGTKALSVAVE